MNNRRKLIVAFGAGAITAPLASFSQQPARIPRVGALITQHRDTFRQGLLEHGWVDGKNILIEFRASGLTPGQAEGVGRELNGLKVDCIVAAGIPTISALKRAVPDIPLVMAHAADVVGSGLVASLRRPGGNITGLTNINEALTGKRLELLKEINPGISRVAVLNNSFSANGAIWKEAQLSARSLRIGIFAVDYRTAEELEAAFAAIAREKADALLVPQNPIASSARARIVSLVARGRLPAMYQNSLWVEDGGLMSYGADEADLWRRSAGYVDKILKGMKPEDLPIQQPTKFELVVNLKTARALGIRIPQSVLLRADRVIE